MQIEDIIKRSGGRYRVVLEDGTAFPLYRKELEEYHIEKDAILSDSTLHMIRTELLQKRARLCALHLLEHQDRTEQQLVKKLSELDYPEDLIADAVSYVKKYRYIDDVRYAVNYIEYRKEQKSKKQLELELLRKGISKEDIQNSFAQIETPDEDAQIHRWLEKKGYSDTEMSPKEKEKIYRFLLRKGYSSSAIIRGMRMESYEYS